MFEKEPEHLATCVRSTGSIRVSARPRMPRSVYNPCQTTTIARSASAFALLMTRQRCRKPCGTAAPNGCAPGHSPLLSIGIKCVTSTHAEDADAAINV